LNLQKVERETGAHVAKARPESLIRVIEVDGFSPEAIDNLTFF